MGTPIINQPEVGILGVGSIQKKPAVIETSEGDVIAIRHKMYLLLRLPAVGTTQQGSLG
jgi:2-oxoglutarate dehydrogenase E2 component (dihydrolipoamide succinyltransferase)